MSCKDNMFMTKDEVLWVKQNLPPLSEEIFCMLFATSVDLAQYSSSYWLNSASWSPMLLYISAVFTIFQKSSNRWSRWSRWCQLSHNLHDKTDRFFVYIWNILTSVVRSALPSLHCREVSHHFCELSCADPSEVQATAVLYKLCMSFGSSCSLDNLVSLSFFWDRGKKGLHNVWRTSMWIQRSASRAFPQGSSAVLSWSIFVVEYRDYDTQLGRQSKKSNVLLSWNYIETTEFCTIICLLMSQRIQYKRHVHGLHQSFNC